MAGITIALSVTNTLLAAVNDPLIKEAILSISYGSNRLEKLNQTVSTVKNMLLDAANMAELSEIDGDYIDKVKDAIYEADDMFDKLLTQAQHAHRRVVSSQILSYVNAAGVVAARHNDAMKVIDMLLDCRTCVYYLAIVGIGGVGKTILAKLVFDDRRIIEEFPIRFWVSVSYLDGSSSSRLDVKEILLNILESLTFELYDSLSVEYLQLEYKRNVQGKRFLLVLDDIRSENIIELRNLKELLMIQGSVSRIIVLTRSKETARIIGNDIHQLEGLPEEHSPRLFDQHLSILRQTNSFQDVNRDESFERHKLMRELAHTYPNYLRKLRNAVYNANDDISEALVSKSRRKQLFEKVRQFLLSDLECSVRHLFVSTPINSNNAPIYGDDFNQSMIRSYLMLRSSQQVELGDELPSFEMPKNWGSLRALALQSTNVVSLPETIGNLLHLRYLNLAYSKMRKLPDSIVRLHNLQTLDISYCKFLVEWPKEFTKLVNLTHLYTDYCLQLSYMPVGMSNLSRMRTLTEFVVEDESTKGMKCVAQLTDLKALVLNLKGRLSIRFGGQFKGVKGYRWEGSCLGKAKHLNQVVISFPADGKAKKEEIVMERMQPHPNLTMFSLSNFKGQKIAKWGNAHDNWALANFLPNLVDIHLNQCYRVQELPMLSKLKHLKSLTLIALWNLAYMEKEHSSVLGSLDATFFPSLEFLHIYDLKNLKSWWRSGDCNKSHYQAFPILSNLFIQSCSRLRSFPACLSCPKVNLTKCNNLVITTADGVYKSTS